MTVSGHNDEYNSVKPRISVISLTIACERSIIIENRVSRKFRFRTERGATPQTCVKAISQQVSLACRLNWSERAAGSKIC